MENIVEYKQTVTAPNITVHNVNKQKTLSRYGPGGAMEGTWSYEIDNENLRITLTMTLNNVIYGEDE